MARVRKRSRSWKLLEWCKGSAMRPIRVVLADDHHVVRVAVATFLAQEPDIEVVGEISEAASLIEVVGRLKPDVLVLDAHMPGQNVIQAAQTMREQMTNLHILVLSAYNRREYVVGLLRAGASGYVLKDDSPEMLVQAIRSVANGKEWLSPRVLKILMRSVRAEEPEPLMELTQRETEVLRLMANGAKNDEIAAALVITNQTVKNHVRSIFNKLGVDSRVDAVLYALEHDLAASPDIDEQP